MSVELIVSGDKRVYQGHGRVKHTSGDGRSFQLLYEQRPNSPPSPPPTRSPETRTLPVTYSYIALPISVELIVSGDKRAHQGHGRVKHTPGDSKSFQLLY